MQILNEGLKVESLKRNYLKENLGIFTWVMGLNVGSEKSQIFDIWPLEKQFSRPQITIAKLIIKNRLLCVYHAKISWNFDYAKAPYRALENGPEIANGAQFIC